MHIGLIMQAEELKSDWVAIQSQMRVRKRCETRPLLQLESQAKGKAKGYPKPLQATVTSSR